MSKRREASLEQRHEEFIGSNLGIVRQVLREDVLWEGVVMVAVFKELTIQKAFIGFSGAILHTVACEI